MSESEKYNLIYRIKPAEKGAGLISLAMEQSYPHLFVAHDIANGIPKNRRIWQLQNPFFYKYDILERILNGDFLYVREQYRSIFPKHIRLTNGFSYYKNNLSEYRTYFPDIYMSSYSCSEIPSIGYYIRNMREESNLAFLNLLKTLPNDIPIVTMGTKEHLQKELMEYPNWKHTYNANEFFSGCSHYFYYRCSDFVDPLPHSLMEAIQSGHRIISPKDIKRTYTDGIDDMLSFVEFDDTFVESNVGTKNNGLNSNKWKSIIEGIVYGNFEKERRVFGHNIRSLYDWFCAN